MVFCNIRQNRQYIAGWICMRFSKIVYRAKLCLCIYKMNIYLKYRNLMIILTFEQNDCNNLLMSVLNAWLPVAFC